MKYTTHYPEIIILKRTAYVEYQKLQCDWYQLLRIKRTARQFAQWQNPQWDLLFLYFQGRETSPQSLTSVWHQVRSIALRGPYSFNEQMPTWPRLKTQTSGRDF